MIFTDEFLVQRHDGDPVSPFKAFSLAKSFYLRRSGKILPDAAHQRTCPFPMDYTHFSCADKRAVVQEFVQCADSFIDSESYQVEFILRVSHALRSRAFAGPFARTFHCRSGDRRERELDFHAAGPEPEPFLVFVDRQYSCIMTERRYKDLRSGFYGFGFDAGLRPDPFQFAQEFFFDSGKSRRTFTAPLPSRLIHYPVKFGLCRIYKFSCADDPFFACFAQLCSSAVQRLLDRSLFFRKGCFTLQ